jgi:glycosyltransferase involved in cell wall biosynthesis
VKVNISVHGRWHAFELANGLHRRDVLGCLATTYPAIVARRFLDADIDLRTRPLLELRRRIHDRWRLGAKPDLAIAKAFARFTARTMASNADVLVGWSSATLEAIQPARAAGLKVVIERGSTHIRNQMRVLSAAYAEFGLDYRGTDDEIIGRELAEYEQCDAIAVPSHYAADTFVAEGIARTKLIVNPYGVDLDQFMPPAGRATMIQPIRILFVGRVGIQKGVPWLLAAVGKLSGTAELHLVGPVDDEAAPFLASLPANVVVRGAMSRADLVHEYARADIFCLPSLQEGGVPLTLLQAMASGLPSVVTPAAQGPVRDGKEGLVVAERSPEALSAALDRLMASAEERRAMGVAARAAVAGGHDWQDYADRAVAAYRTLLS